MSMKIPLVKFEESERVPIEVIHRQSAAIAENPLTTELLNAALNYVFIINRQRQIVFASHNCKDLFPGHPLDELLGLRPGEALACEHATSAQKGCGTTAFCRECGAAKAIIASLMGHKSVEECRLTRIINCQPASIDLLVCAIPFVYQGESFSILSLADISHEKRRFVLEQVLFRDHLITAEGLGSFAKPTDSPNRKGLEHSLVQQGLRHLLEEIQAQRDLDLAEKNLLSTHPEPTESLALLKAETQSFKQHPAAAKRRLKIDPQAASLVFKSDSTLLRRMLGHLIKNALEAIPEGQTVTLSCQRENQQLRFCVHNPGILAPAAQLQVFQRSYTTKGSGHGLGTYSVKLLAEKYLRGKTGFISTPEQGTTFWFSVPIETEATHFEAPRNIRTAGDPLV
jgi:hypothetical protein